MRLSIRIFIGYCMIVGLATFFLFTNVRNELRPAVKQALEDSMVETANVLAAFAAKDFVAGTLASGEFAANLEAFRHRRPNAQVWDFLKITTTYNVYITDAHGIVVYDSNDGRAVGEDYSRWNDVYLTLRGKYGARSTRDDPNDPLTSVMYVAAPIQHNGATVGVLTVWKRVKTIEHVVQRTERNIIGAGITLAAVALTFSALSAFWLGRSTRTLARYASDVSEGKKAAAPRIREPELAQVGAAMESMRTALEGKEYVERYVHALTHEIKSPLAGLRGAAELLTEDMPAEERMRFLANISTEVERIQHIIDRLLDLARVEHQQTLGKVESIAVRDLIEDLWDHHTAAVRARNVTLDLACEGQDTITGERFLVVEAVDNVLMNAIEFSPQGGTITVTGRRSEDTYTLTIADTGPGIPEYARAKIFDRFYSLARPDSGKKSSGLGLSFVREVMDLHGGAVVIESHAHGARVVLRFPVVSP